MNAASTQPADSAMTNVEAPRNLQFSLRAMLIAVTLAAVLLAIAPKDDSVILWLFFVPQLVLSAWAGYCGCRPPHAHEPRDTLFSWCIYTIALLSGLAWPMSWIISVNQISVWGYSILFPRVFFAIYFSTLALFPCVFLLSLFGAFRRGQLPLVILHSYNALAMCSGIFFLYLAHGF